MQMKSRLIFLVILLFVLYGQCVHAYDVVLEWTPSPERTVTKYNIYQQYGTNVFAQVASVSATNSTATLTGLKEDVNYRFYATSADDHGGESEPSNIATYRPLPKLGLSSPNPYMVLIKMTTQRGNKYELEQSSDLKTWTSIYSFTALGTTFNYAVQKNQPKMFFRLKLLTAPIACNNHSKTLNDQLGELAGLVVNYEEEI
jgi:hypothetical protein